MNHLLLLSVDLKSWQVTSKSHGTLLDRSINEETKQKYAKKLKEADYTCYYCGFRSQEWQEIDHINHDHHDNSESNLRVVCPLCHQCHHLNSANINSGGHLIWLPELSQTELNHLCRVLFIAHRIKIESNGRNQNFIVENSLSHIWSDIFLSRKSFLDQQFGVGCSDLGQFGQILLDIQQNDPKKYANREGWLKHFKLLPNPKRFHVQTEFWKNDLINQPETVINNWLNLANQIENVKLDTKDKIKGLFDDF